MNPRVSLTVLGLGEHLGERSLRLALAAVHGLARVTLVVGHGIGAEKDTQLPGVALRPTPFMQSPVLDWARDWQSGEKIRRATPKSGSDLGFLGSPNGIRTRAATLRGWCPRPLDDGAE